MSLQDAAIAVNRFGFGARPGDIQAVANDPRGWLKAQLTAEKSVPAPLASLPSTEDAAQEFNHWRSSLGLDGAGGGRGYQYRGAGMGSPGMSGGRGMGQSIGVEGSYARYFFPGYQAAVAARMKVATTTERPYYERLVRFWGNHFTVSATKPAAIALAPVFERDVCRTHAVGGFRDLLLASCKHPGMLVYLDNYLSIGPNSTVAKNPNLLPAVVRGRLTGLNENLGREILELHTLGVRSGYTQADVTSLAKMITGWTVRYGGRGVFGGGDEGADANAAFNFAPAAHEPGPQTFFGKVYGQDGLAQGEAALTDVAHHPATASHIATKLVRHFVADEPTSSAVERIATVFRQSDGDLQAVSVALVDLPEAWTPGVVKMKPPEDYLTSAMRAMNGEPQLSGQQLVALLDRMGQRPFYAKDPNGWADVEGEWIGPDAVWKRVEFADAMGKGVGAAMFDPTQIAEQALGPTLTPATYRAIKQAESPAQGLALFLTAPEFQRR